MTGNGISCPGDCTGNYSSGSTVQLTASPSDGYQFDQWTGCDSSNGNQCTVTMNGAENITAVFTEMIRPKIADITCSPDIPVTGKNVTFEALITEVEGFDSIVITWKLGDVVTKGSGVRCKIKPPVQTHGRAKIEATLSCRDEESGQKYFDSFSKEFNLFFDKDGDDDGDGIPNWFTYWKKDKTVPDIDKADFLKGKACDAIDGGGENSYGAYRSGSQVYITDCGATKRSEKTYNFDTDQTFYGTDGIDTAAQVIAHELNHKMIYEKNKSGGDWDGKTNSDFVARGTNDTRDYNDRLPDEIESGGSGELYQTSSDKTDTYDLENQKRSYYKYYGDGEYTCIIAGNSAGGTDANDWSDTGKIAGAQGTRTSSRTRIVNNSFLSSNGNSIHKSGTGGGSKAGEPELVEFNRQRKRSASRSSKLNSFTEKVEDEDGDGLHDKLIISVNLTVPEPMTYFLMGWLEDLSGNEVGWASATTDLDSGSQTVNLEFDGMVFYESRLGGPYVLRRVEFRMEDDYLLDYKDDAYTTSDYSYSDFEHPATRLGDSYSDNGEDTDGNGKYDSLNIHVPVITDIAGQYELSGWLYTDSDQPVGYAETTETLSSGTTEMLLTFSGTAVRQLRTDGPYILKQVQLLDESETRVDSDYIAYTTSAYSYLDFQGGAIELTSYKESAVDSDNDGDIDTLNVDVTMQVSESGNYMIYGELVDSDDKIIFEATAKADYSSVPSSQTVSLEFPGDTIRRSGTDGPYYLKNVIIQGADGIADHQVNAYTTQPYRYTDFGIAVNLSDAILALKVAAGIPADAADIVDINEDGKIGLEEAIYALQVAAGLRD